MMETQNNLLEQKPIIKPKHLGSDFDDECILLKTILDIHNDGAPIQLDPMFSKGNIYRRLQEPELKFDLRVEREDVKLGDATDLKDIKNNSIKSICLDPPFCFGIHGKVKENISAQRFTVLQDFDSLKILYKGILKEAFRVLENKGLLLFKCQDYTDSKTTMTHCFVWKWAIEQGFYAQDLAILINKKRIFNPNLKQRHLRKTHCYYWVFKKKRNGGEFFSSQP